MKPRMMLLVLVVLFWESGAVWARGFGGGGGIAHGGGMTGHPGSGVMRGRFSGTTVGGFRAQGGFRSSNSFLGNRFVSVVPFHQAAVRVFPGTVFPGGQQTHFRGFHRRGFFDGDGFFDGGGFFNGDGGVGVTVEQAQPAPITEPQQPTHKGRYVQPHWVDGGYGVQILEPGYWTDTESETRH